MTSRIRLLAPLIATLCACSSRTEPPASPTAPIASPTVADMGTPATDASAQAPNVADPAIVAEIRALHSRHACNRVTGCPGLTGLMRHGSALIPAARQALLGGSRPDGHWILVLIEAIGQLEDPSAGDILIPLLSENRWEIQVAAARGLAFLGPHMTDANLTALRDARAARSTDSPADRALAAALDLAILRSDRDSRPYADAKAAMRELFPPPDAIADTPHPQLDVFVRLVADARLPEALPAVRQALHSGNRFVTATALDVVGTLQDTGAIGFVLPLLEDHNPTLRREAVRALQRITGARQLETAAEWREWTQNHGIAPVPMAATKRPGPSVVLEPDELPSP